jgi:hypothetical protein
MGQTATEEHTEKKEEKKGPLLKKIGSIGVSGTNRFVLTEEILGEANILTVEPSFREIFSGKIEEDVQSMVLNVSRLNRASSNEDILNDLDRYAKISLFHFLELIKRQSRGERHGLLLTDRCVNIAYVLGNDGTLWSIGAAWCTRVHCWHVRTSPDKWAGFRVVSRAL